MNEYKINTDIISTTGITIDSRNISTSTGKVVINNVEVTDINSWNKAISTFSELGKKINNLQSKIDKANELLEEILVVSDYEHEGRFRPVKGTTTQDVYKTIVKLNELLETPRRINYELLKEDK